MKIRFLVLLSFMSLLSACSFLHHDAATADASYPMLDTTAVFDSAQVAGWHPTQAAREYAQDLYHRGAALYVKEHNDTAAYKLLQRSLRIAPDAYTYLEILPVAWRLDRIDVCWGATAMALLDRRTSAQALIWAARLQVQYDLDDLTPIEAALQANPFAIDEIAKDTFFYQLNTTASFQALIAKYRYLTSPEHKDRALLGILLSRTSLAQMPYIIPPDSLCNREVNTIAPIFKDILPAVADGRGEWSRSMMQEYDLIRELPVSSSYHTIVYSSSLFYVPMTTMQYYIATIDTSGHFIDAMKAGCFSFLRTDDYYAVLHRHHRHVGPLYRCHEGWLLLQSAACADAAGRYRRPHHTDPLRPAVAVPAARLRLHQ